MMEMPAYVARMAAHKATLRREAAEYRLLLCYDGLNPKDCSDEKYVKALGEYREAEWLEGEAWKYSWKREREGF